MCTQVRKRKSKEDTGCPRNAPKCALSGYFSPLSFLRISVLENLWSRISLGLGHHGRQPLDFSAWLAPPTCFAIVKLVVQNNQMHAFFVCIQWKPPNFWLWALGNFAVKCGSFKLSIHQLLMLLWKLNLFPRIRLQGSSTMVELAMWTSSLIFCFYSSEIQPKVDGSIIWSA